MIGTYYPHSKNIHNLKNMEFENLKIWKYFSNIYGANVYDIQNKVVVYNTRCFKKKHILI
jgi:hypothetical protein